MIQNLPASVCSFIASFTLKFVFYLIKREVFNRFVSLVSYISFAQAEATAGNPTSIKHALRHIKSQICFFFKHVHTTFNNININTTAKRSLRSMSVYNPLNTFCFQAKSLTGFYTSSADDGPHFGENTEPRFKGEHLLVNSAHFETTNRQYYSLGIKMITLSRLFKGQ